MTLEQPKDAKIRKREAFCNWPATSDYPSLGQEAVVKQRLSDVFSFNCYLR